MTLQASTVSVYDSYKGTKDRAVVIKSRAQDLYDRSLAGPISVKDVGDFATLIADGNDIFNIAVGSYGSAVVNPIAQQQENNASYDFIGNVTSLQGAMSNVVTWINSNYPRATGGSPLFFSGALQEYTFDAKFRRLAITVTTSQTVGLRTQLQSITSIVV